MNILEKLCVAATVLLLAACPGLGSQEPQTAEDLPEEPTWSEDVKPILDRTCNECHSVPPQQAAPGNLRLDVCEMVGGLPGAKIMASRIVARTLDKVPSAMPPTDYPEQVTPDEEEILRRWVEQGASCDDDVNPNNPVNNTGVDMGMDPGDMGTPTPDMGTPTADMGTDMGVDMDPGNNDNNAAGLAAFDLMLTIINLRCSTATCHGMAGGRGNLEIPPGATAEQLQTALSGNALAPAGVPFVTPNDVDQSALYLRIASDGGGAFTQMPQGGNALSASQQQYFIDWINAGAPYP